MGVCLPSTGFNQQKPEILTLKPLPIPPGHNAGPFEVSSNKKAIRKRSRDLHCVSKRTQQTEDGADHEFIGRVFEYEDGRRYRRAEGATNGNNEEVGAEDPYDSDEEIEVDEDEINLGFEERGFIDFCVKMMTNGVDDRTLGQSMTNHMYSDKASTLIENGFLEKVTLAQNKVYYYPTEKGQIAVDADLSPDEKGELGGESPMHRIGVRMIATYYEQRGYDVEMYATPQGTSDKLDVIARPTDESEDDNRKLVEVETSPEKKGHVEDDFQTLASHQGDSIWVVQNLDNAKKLFSCLAGYIDKPDMNSDNFEVISDQLDYAGLTQVFGINQLRRELE